MNIILLEPSELAADGTVRLGDERAEHLRRVLKVVLGQHVRVGILDGPQGEGEVIQLEEASVTLRCRCDKDDPQLSKDTLLLAYARPKVLSRCLEHATALGFGRIVLFRSRRVEKSHLSSHALEPLVMDRHVRRGLEQSRRTRRPSIALVSRFRELIEERLGLLVPEGNRFVADADATEEAALAPISPAGLSIVIGPEGGLIDYELERFAQSGFQLVRTGTAPLRVETALSYVTGQLRAAQLAANRSL